MKENTIILGNGYIGSAFGEKGYKVLDRSQFDYIVDGFDRLKELISSYDIVINCIAVTDTRWSEIPENFKTLWWINAHFVHELSEYCRKTNKKLVQLSTADLYGNVFEYDLSREDRKQLDIQSEYRFSKLSGEKFCNDEDLIIRFRLPFDGRNHPKNLLRKTWNFTKFYPFQTSITYVPDLINSIEVLLQKNQRGIFNVVTKNFENTCCYSIINIWNEVLKEDKFKHIDGHNYVNDPNLIYDLSTLHIHNIINTDKILEFYQTTSLDVALLLAWDKLKNYLT